MNRFMWCRHTFRMVLLLPVLSAACTKGPSFREVAIHGMDYAFRAPATLPAGLTAFRFINDGTVRHELQIFRFHPGISVQDAGRILARDSLLRESRDSTFSILIADRPDQQPPILVDLAQGDIYGLRCNFQNADSLPRHLQLGMIAVLRVE